jgi:uncharacterized membrane protein YdjX (TVP38/TMEM64 family)
VEEGMRAGLPVAGKWLLLAAAAAAAALLHLLGLGRHLTLASLRENRELLAAWYSAHPVAASSAFVAVYVVQTAFSLPGAAVLSLAAGAVFGVAAGTVLAVAGATLGAAASFVAVRYLFRDALLSRFGKALEPLNRELSERGLPYLLFLRLVPVFPFFLVNLAAGLTAIPFRTFLLGTVAGIVPGGLVYVNAGANLAAVRSPSDAASPRVLLALALMGLFALAPALHSRLRRRRGGGGNGGIPPGEDPS